MNIFLCLQWPAGDQKEENDIEDEESEDGIEVERSEVAETIGRMGLRFAENFWDR